MKCDKCGNWNEPDTRHSTICGTVLAQKKKCTQGLTSPPTLEDCPWCPRPGVGSCPKTQVEPTLKQSGGIEPFAIAGVYSSHANINVADTKGRIKIWITDQDSMNGTRLHGENILNDKPDLTHGNRIGIGDVEMKPILLPGRQGRRHV